MKREYVSNERKSIHMYSESKDSPVLVIQLFRLSPSVIEELSKNLSNGNIMNFEKLCYSTVNY